MEVINYLTYLYKGLSKETVCLHQTPIRVSASLLVRLFHPSVVIQLGGLFCFSVSSKALDLVLVRKKTEINVGLCTSQHLTCSLPPTDILSTIPITSGWQGNRDRSARVLELDDYWTFWYVFVLCIAQLVGLYR